MSNDDLSDEDKALFRNQMRNVKPLKTTVVHEYKPAKSSPHQQKTQLPQKAISDQPLKQLSDFVREFVSANCILRWSKNGFSEKRLKELANGKIPLESRLDLHGKTVEEASSLLIAFMRKCTTHQYQSVLIIHGKGEKNNKPAILKNQLNVWLPQFEEVLAFHSALPKHGGTGALYVLLKRMRKER